MANEIPHIDKKTTLDVDRQHLSNVRGAFLKLNQARFDLGQDGVKPSQRFMLDILASLLHFNHPMLPGYVSRTTPYGIDTFDASGEQLLELKRLTRSFHPTQPVNKEADILALFSMGSFGSIAQNSQSDIDLWVCYRPDLDTESLRQLDDKCKKISEWAKRNELDITFFLMNDQTFEQEKKLAFNHDGSGSTQHYLLLDEFYRTLIHWAGQLPAWIFVSPHQEHDYQKYCSEIQQQRFLPEEKFVDFGKISTIPADECISSAIWQLYKAISSPYKSIIKLLLLEIYCQKLFEPLILSNLFKQHLHGVDDKQIIHHWDVDPYLQTYYCIEGYLQTTNQFKRLEFLRRCFYFKLEQPLSRGYETSAKASILHEMTKVWSWNDAYIKNLDDHKDWNIKDTLEEKRLIINELNHSYHYIMDFFREKKIKIQASNKELNILGRKLHAAFSRKSGKIEWINPLSSENLGETKLIFQRKSNTHLWVVLDKKKILINKKNTLTELIIWLHCNGILLSNTKIFFDESNVRSELIESLRKIIVANIPLPIKTAEHRFFEKSAYLKKLILFVDYRPKPTSPGNSNNQTLMFDCHIDLFSVNSWNEIICNSQRGDFLKTALEIYVNALIKSSDIRATDIIIHCPDRQKEIKLQEKLAIIFNNIYLFFKNKTSARYIIYIENQYVAVHVHDKKYEIQWLDSERSLKKYLMTPMFYYSFVGMDDATMRDHPLKVFTEYSRQDSIQVFFKPKNNIAEVTLIDEMGAWHQCVVNYQQGIESMQSLHRFLRVVHDRRDDQSCVDVGPFNIFPINFYEISQNYTKLQIKKKSVSSRLDNSDVSTIYAVVDCKDKDFKFTAYIDDVILSEIDDEAYFYKSLIDLIAKRSCLETFHNYYIADIDLSRCRFNLSKSGELQTIHYLKIKKLFEDKINRAVIEQRSLQ
ncbi:MAG: adenylate cyclase class 1 [Cellvibrionaceae bacterium]|jgi:adenylate cyclase class 1